MLEQRQRSPAVQQCFGFGVVYGFFGFYTKDLIQILFHITPVGQRLLSCGQQVPSLRAVDLGL